MFISSCPAGHTLPFGDWFGHFDWASYPGLPILADSDWVGPSNTLSCNGDFGHCLLVINLGNIYTKDKKSWLLLSSVLSDIHDNGTTSKKMTELFCIFHSNRKKHRKQVNDLSGCLQKQSRQSEFESTRLENWRLRRTKYDMTSIIIGKNILVYFYFPDLAPAQHSVVE